MGISSNEKGNFGLKRLGYYFIRYWVTFGLFCYYRKIRIIGRENIPKDKAVLLLSNHQNALLDILLIATNCPLRPWFLTRADIFKSKPFRPFFTFLQMLPIYRIRDGKASLSKNAAIFKKCAALLNRKQAILLFPEANHNLERRVRPLSKGFTRLIFSALDENRQLDIRLVPIGQNYVSATTFPDSASIYYGKPIAVQPLLKHQERQSVSHIKTAVSKALKKLTTHVDESLCYEESIEAYDGLQPDYSCPMYIDQSFLTKMSRQTSKTDKKFKFFEKLSRVVFEIINLPMVLLWRLWLKPKAPEKEFIATFRFGFCLLGYSLSYLLALVILSVAFNLKTACLFILGHAVLNILFVKWLLPTSSPQKI